MSSSKTYTVLQMKDAEVDIVIVQYLVTFHH